MKFFIQLVIVNFIGTGIYWTTVSSHNDGHSDNQKRILIQDNYYTIMSKLEALTQKVDTLTAQNNNLSASSGHDVVQALNKKIDVLTRQNNNISAELANLKMKTGSSSHGVSFYVRLTRALSGTTHYIHYDEVVVNNGNVYNTNHAMFVTPVNGTYLFNVYACTTARKSALLHLMVNQTSHGVLYVGDSYMTACHSEPFIVQLKSGDEVYVKTDETHTSDILADPVYGLSTFSGYLI